MPTPSSIGMMPRRSSNASASTGSSNSNSAALTQKLLLENRLQQEIQREKLARLICATKNSAPSTGQLFPSLLLRAVLDSSAGAQSLRGGGSSSGGSGVGGSGLGGGNLTLLDVLQQEQQQGLAVRRASLGLQHGAIVRRASLDLVQQDLANRRAAAVESALQLLRQQQVQGNVSMTNLTPPSRPGSSCSSTNTPTSIVTPPGASPPSPIIVDLTGANSPNVIDNNDYKWLSWLNKLKQFRKEYGHCLVFAGYPRAPRLAAWVDIQRQEFERLQDGKETSLTPERVALLEQLDFRLYHVAERLRLPEELAVVNDNKNEMKSIWMDMFDELKEYKKESSTRGEHSKLTPKLASWVARQRIDYKLVQAGKTTCMLTPERIALLSNIGFNWNFEKAIWARHVADMNRFNAETGRSPPSDGDFALLCGWINRQHWHYAYFTQGKPSLMTKELAEVMAFFLKDDDSKDDDNMVEDSYSSCTAESDESFCSR